MRHSFTVLGSYGWGASFYRPKNRIITELSVLVNLGLHEVRTALYTKHQYCSVKEPALKVVWNFSLLYHEVKSENRWEN